MKEVLTLSDTQKYLKLGRAKTKHLLESKQIPAQKIGTRWRVHRDAVIAWLKKEKESEKNG
ncbi:helix-turn-helix domain-containing protein [Hydrogenispora ethanolica]|uniref:helix-turn-helix domain-containing protein n=1 Tax=Hydrogenispora ethanolica TaxID=1082276 RepID=UPI00104D527E